MGRKRAAILAVGGVLALTTCGGVAFAQEVVGDEKLVQGRDELFTTFGDKDQTLRGTTGRDQMYTWGGDDRLFGNDGADEMYGGHGSDVINGQGGNDDPYGGSGNDRITGGSGQDALNGGAGADSMNGGPGIDEFVGGDNNDTIVSLDGQRDIVNCGLGVDDQVLADRFDHVSGDCERFTTREGGREVVVR